MIVRVPLDVGVVVPVPEIHVNVHVAHDVGEAQLPDRFAQDDLGRLAQGEIRRLPADAQSRPSVGVMKRADTPAHFAATLTTKMSSAMSPTRIARG